MEPLGVIIWASCLALGWIVFSTITGANQWLASLFGARKPGELEERIRKLESRLEELERQG